MRWASSFPWQTVTQSKEHLLPTVVHCRVCHSQKPQTDRSEWNFLGGSHKSNSTDKAFLLRFHQRLHQQGQRFVAAGDAHRLTELPRRAGCRLDPHEHLLDWLGQQEHLGCLGRWQEEESSDRHWAEWAAGHRGGSTPGVSSHGYDVWANRCCNLMSSTFQRTHVLLRYFSVFLFLSWISSADFTKHDKWNMEKGSHGYLHESIFLVL